MAKRIQDIEKISDLYVSKTNIQEFIDRLQKSLRKTENSLKEVFAELGLIES